MKQRLRKWRPRCLPPELLSAVAKLLADVTFYIPAILGYELCKQQLRRFEDEP
jgi:hypothetical protein